MDHKVFCKLIVKTETSKTELMQQCGVSKITINGMIKGTAPVPDSVQHYLVNKLNS
mgnify:FL=1|tara:strand:+ start:190 stop:357 length:168 start_codon:yes stop_codon:yes gene_type:complete